MHHTSEVRKGWVEERKLELVPSNFAVEGFAGVKQVARLTRYRYHKRSGKESVETVYLITNLAPEEADAKRLLAWTRGHWVIENNLHRSRDVFMGEDASRIRQGNAPSVLAALSNAVIGLLKRRGQHSVKLTAELLRANPALALSLLTCTIWNFRRLWGELRVEHRNFHFLTCFHDVPDDGEHVFASTRARVQRSGHL